MPAEGGGGKGGGGRDVKAGGAWIELFAVDKITGVLSKVESKLKAFSSITRRLGGAMMGAGGILGAGPLGLLIGGANRLADIDRLAKSMNAPADAVARLQFAADSAGVSLDELMKNPARYAQDIAAAPKVDVEEIKAAAEAQKEFRTATTALQLAMMPLLKAMVPVIKQVGQFVRENADVIRVVAVAGAGLFALGSAVSSLSVPLGLAGTAVGLLSSAVGLILSPLGLVTAAVGGLGYLFATQTGKGREMTTKLGEGFEEFAETAKDAWGGIVAAVGRGDLSAAFGVICAALKFEWKKVTLYWTETLENWQSWLRNTWEDLTDWMAAKLAGVADFFVDAWGEISTLWGGTKGGPSKLADAVREGAKVAERDRLARQKREKDAAMAEGMAEIQAARQQLVGALAVAHGPGGPAGPGGDPDLFRRMHEMIKPWDAVKSGFLTPAAQQQFGYGDKVSEQTGLLKMLAEGKGGFVEKIGAAVAANMKMK